MFPKCSPQLSYAILILTEALLLSVPISSDTNPYQAPYPCFSFLLNKQLIGAWAHFGKFIRKRKATWEKVVGFLFSFFQHKQIWSFIAPPAKDWLLENSVVCTWMRLCTDMQCSRVLGNSVVCPRTSLCTDTHCSGCGVWLQGAIWQLVFAY